MGAAMIPEHLAKLEQTLRTSANIPEGTRRELLDLVADLKAEVATAAPGAEAPGSTLQAVGALSSSVRQLEATHPQLVEMVNQITNTLSNLGI